ncbi:MAG TPA: hypothetical protein PKH24_09350, partial [Sedimentisphaerales bacterium]|nr:hypothetical protein [Sedimentisphaerales bacterium]HNU29411.1 hypothetical protein [Sedimentisphaerales bacterium]
MRRVILTVTSIALWTALGANADVTTWTGQGAGADRWGDPNYWSAGVPDAGDTALFATEGYLVHFDGDTTIAGLELHPSASGSRWLIFGEYTLTASWITNDSTAGTLLDLGTDVNAPDGGLSVLANAGPITLAGAGPDYVETITLNGDLEIGGDNDVHIYGPIVGNGGITKDGSGTLLIHVSEYTNEFLGDVTLHDGLLVLAGYDSNDMDNPTGDALGHGNVYLYGGTLGFTGNLSEDYEMINPTQVLYIGGPDGNAVTIDAAHVGSEVPLGDGIYWSQYVAGLDDDGNDGFDVVIMNSLVLGYDDGNGVVPASLVLGNPTDGDELLVEFEPMVEDDPGSSTITLLGTDVMHELTVYAEADIEHKITGDGGISITSDSTGLLILLNTENDFAGGVEVNGGTLVVADSNQAGTSTLGTGTLTLNGDAAEFGKVIVSGTPREIYYDDAWLDEDDNPWDESVDTVEIGNEVEMQGKIAFAGYSFVEMDDWFDDGNDVEVALIGSNIEISGPTTLVGDTAIAVVTEETDADDEVSDDAIADLNLAENYFTLKISGAIGESGGSHTLGKFGDGTLILSGVNTFTGGLDVNEGAVLLDVEDAVATAPVTIAEGATVQFGADQTLLALHGSGLLDAQVNNLTLGNGESLFSGTFENLLGVTIAGGTHVIDANLSVQSLAVDAGTLTLNGDTGSDQAITIASGATAVVNGSVEFFFGDAIENSGTLVGDTSSLGDVAIDLQNGSTLKADEDGLVASSVSIDDHASVTLDSSDGLLTLDDPTFSGGGAATISQTGDNAASIRNLDNRVGCTITFDSGTLYLTGDEIWACDWPGQAGGEIIVEDDAMLIVDAPTHFISFITGDGTIVKTVNAFASEEDYLNDLGTVDGNDLTLADATIATSQGGTLEITKNVAIESGATVAVVGASTVVVAANQTLTASDNATLDVGDTAQMQIDGALSVEAGETLNITGGGTVAINSGNSGLGSTATVAVSDSTLR